MKLVFNSLLICVLFINCNSKPAFTYQYKDQEQTIQCNDASALLNEALYAFEADIMEHNFIENKTLNTAYAQFVFKGMTGSAPYDKIIRQHTLDIRNQLIAENILIRDGIKSNLNYSHPEVSCIIDGIADEDLKKTIKALISINNMDPNLFNSRLRNFGRQSQTDRYQALYIALDSYYQHILDLELETEAVDE